MINISAASYCQGDFWGVWLFGVLESEIGNPEWALRSGARVSRAFNFTDGPGLRFVTQFSCQVLKMVAGQIIGESFGCTEKNTMNFMYSSDKS